MADDIALGYSGQRVLSVISVLVVFMSGGVGFLIGSVSPSQANAIDLWLFAFQPTPINMAVYIMTITMMVFLALFSFIKILS